MDHDVDFLAGDSFDVALGPTLFARNAIGGRKVLTYSSVAGVLAGYFCTNVAALISERLCVAVPSPARKLEKLVH